MIYQVEMIFLKIIKKPIARLSAKTIMEQLVKESGTISKDDSVLEKMTYRHAQITQKLGEASFRLTNVAINLGGDFPKDFNSEELHPLNNHISVYENLLTSNEQILDKIFTSLERLEHLTRK